MKVVECIEVSGASSALALGRRLYTNQISSTHDAQNYGIMRSQNKS